MTPDASTLDALSSHAAFRSVDRDSVRRLWESGAPIGFDIDAVLLREGDTSDSALFLLDGEVAIEAETSFGAVTLARLQAPALLGEIGVFADLPRTATVRALSQGRALSLPAEGLLAMSRASPDLLRHVVLQLGGRIKSFNHAIGTYTNALAALESADEDIGILEDLLHPPAELTNFALTFRKLAAQISQRRARQREMANAAAIQRSLLPSGPFVPDETRLAIHAAFRPASDVGGDFYDVFRIDADRIAVTIGDVSGKGVPASLFMAVCQTVMRYILKEEKDPARAAERVNAILDADNAQSMFATFFGAVIDLSRGEIVFVNCGHNPPFLLRADGRTERLSVSPPEPPLAAWSPVAFSNVVLPIGVGDRLVAYTDGVSEAVDPALEEFGEDRLLACLGITRGQAGEGVAAAVIAEVDGFAGSAPQHDDLTCLVVDFRVRSA